MIVDKRLLRFFIIASVAFLLTTLLQPILFPPRKAANPAKPDAKATQATDPQGNSEANKSATADDLAEKQEDAAPLPAVASESALQPAETQEPPPPSRELHPNRLVTLGSYGPASPDKLVATFNSRGATIHRLELNARQRKGQLRYRDLETTAAYIGQLEPSTDASGCLVNCLTPGTPAADAGIRVGDHITHVADEPVVSANDFLRLMERFKPGESIPMRLARGDLTAPETINLSVASQTKPLQVIGPHSGALYDPAATGPESLLVTLRHKTAGEWPELDDWMRTADWEVAQTTRDGRPVLEFSLDLPGSPPGASHPHGPLRAIKRYGLPEPTANDDFAPNFHVQMELEFQNRADTPQALAFELGGPTGTNIEGWWYQNKIHGRSSAFFQVAGARDIVSSNAARPFVFWGGPEIVKNFTSYSPELQEVFSPNVTPPENKAMRYVGVDTQYFAVALLPATAQHPPAPISAESFRPYSAFTHVVDSRDSIGKNNRLQRAVDLTFRMFSDEIELAPAGAAGSESDSYRQGFEIFAGPKESRLLSEYGLSDLISYGWFAWVSRPLVGFLRFFYGIFGNYGIAIVLLTVFVRLAIFPISRRAQMNAARHAKMMQFLQPEIKKLQEKYKDNLEKRAKAQNELFKRYNYSPLSMFGGCLLMFLQLPIFIGLYRGLSVDIALRGQPLIPGIRWCSNLAGPDQFLLWKDWLPFGLADEQGMFGPFLNILPLITVALFLVQTKLFSPPPTDDQQRMAQRVMTLTMAFMGVLFFKVPAGLCIYFITSSLWGILERQFIPKPQLPSQFGEADEGRGAGSGRTESSVADARVLTNEKERESRRRLDRDRQRRLRESQQ